MANTNNPYGFKPWGPILSSHCYSNTAAAIYRWDVVDISAGYVQAASAGSLALIGSSAGYWAASAGRVVLCFDDPNQKYECQDIGTGTTSAQARVGEYSDHTATAANTTLLRSKHSLTGTYGTTGTIWANAGSVTSVPGQGGFALLDLVQAPDNAWGAYARVVVGIQEHILKTGASA